MRRVSRASPPLSSSDAAGKKWEVVTQFYCMAFILGYRGFLFFSLSVLKYIAGSNASDIIVRQNLVADLESYEVISQVSYL